MARFRTLPLGDPLLFVRNEANLGFAGGINVGLRYVLRVGGFDYVWLLNNDTVVRPDALEHLLRRMEAEPRIGLRAASPASFLAVPLRHDRTCRERDHRGREQRAAPCARAR
jgi:cellulose synthase/poly-beta-1,6-N-acetylglucosamine synthase-like glycosyltransferase